MKASTFERLKQLRVSLAGTAAYPWMHMEAWIAAALPFIRTALPEHLDDFERLSETPRWAQLARFVSGGSRWEGTPRRDNFAEASAKERELHTAAAEKAKANLVAWLDGLLLLPVDAEQPNVPAARARVRMLVERIPAVVRVLSRRRTGRPALTLEDEYDLQYLLHALLTVEAKDVRPEEWTPSYAGSSSRMDFLLKQERIVVEAKYVRTGHTDREIADELVIDKERYAAHPDCEALVCVVYDPDRLLRNPEALQSDLSQDSDPLTEVLVRPQ